MGFIDVNPGGLQHAAGQHDAVAIDILDGAPAAGVSGTGQATSAAVAAANTLVNTASGLLAARLSATGSAISTVGVVMSEQEQVSSRQISAVYRT
jgi:hypothetical protein